LELKPEKAFRFSILAAKKSPLEFTIMEGMKAHPSHMLNASKAIVNPVVVRKV